LDNATAHKAADYEREVAKTIPFHAELIAQAIDVGLSVHPKRWLDTGAGPGRLAQKVHEKGIDVWIADPSEAMLEVARENNPDLPSERFILAPSEDLPAIGPFDVITAVQSHHYGDRDARKRAVRRCKDLLSKGGMLIVFENVRAETDEAHIIQRARWANWQRAQGRDEISVEKHLAREGAQFHPIRPSEHIALLTESGFRVVEMFYRAYGQAGFFAIR
jgi:tRNA (cmo5U34)-methyltransferase